LYTHYVHIFGYVCNTAYYKYLNGNFGLDHVLVKLINCANRSSVWNAN